LLKGGFALPGRRWLDELIADPTASADSTAKRENCSARKINMTISLAFLTPDLVKAAIDLGALF
jgi:site-specific DNA recombinase